MEDVTNPADEAGDSVVVSGDQVEATATDEQGQVEGQPAEDNEGDTPDASTEEETVSKSKARRERQKAYVRDLETKLKQAEDREARIKAAAEAEKPPVEADFEDFTEYQIAKALHKQASRSDDRERAAVEAEKAEIERQRQEEVATIWREQVQEASAKYSDFDRVAMRSDLPVTREMGDAILEVDNGPDVLYHLGSNPELAKDISSLPPMRQAIRIAQISAQISAPQPKTATTAPPPPPKVQARGGTRRNPSDMSMPEYEAWVNKRGRK